MEIIWTALVGFVAGMVARAVHPGKDDLGIIMTAVLGIAGSFIASYLGQALGWYIIGEPAGFVAAVVGAMSRNISACICMPTRRSSSLTPARSMPSSAWMPGEN